MKKKITIELDDICYRLLEVLMCGPYAPQSVEEVVGQLVDHAQQGVYRPGARGAGLAAPGVWRRLDGVSGAGRSLRTRERRKHLPAAEAKAIRKTEGCVMARIPRSEIDRIKNEISLQRLVEASGIELKRHGAKDLVGRCPFHNDRTPSLVITPSTNEWHCMGACNEGGERKNWRSSASARTACCFRRAWMRTNTRRR